MARQIRGTMVLPDGAPVSGGTLHIEALSSHPGLEAVMRTTDSAIALPDDGAYDFMLEIGRYKIHYTYPDGTTRFILGIAHCVAGGPIDLISLIELDFGLGVPQYQGPWDASLGYYPPDADVGDVYVIDTAGTINGVYLEIGYSIIYDGAGWDIYHTAPTPRYIGPWDASSGSYPSDALRGFTYIVDAGGVVNGVSYSIGDRITYNGTGWDVYRTAPIPPDAVTISSDYTIGAGDINAILVATAALTITLPAGFDPGSWVSVVQESAGRVSFAAGNGATISIATPFLAKTRTQYSAMTAQLLADASEWLVSGDCQDSSV